MHEVKLNTYLFSSEDIKNDYQKFTAWLSTTKGAKTAKLKNNNFIEFFIRCDELWGEIPSYQPLVHEFKPQGLRHNLTVLRWLIETDRVVEDLETKDYVAEQERITKLLGKFDNGLPKEIALYHQELMQKHRSQEIALRTVRLSLQAVVGIYTTMLVKSDCTPNQEQIDVYLTKKRGQYNSLISFVRFLNSKYNQNLKCNRPRPEDVAKATRKQLESSLMLLAVKPHPLSDKDELFWSQICLALFHDTTISLSALKAITPKPMNDDMQVIKYNNKDYCIPKPKGLDTS